MEVTRAEEQKQTPEPSGDIIAVTSRPDPIIPIVEDEIGMDIPDVDVKPAILPVLCQIPFSFRGDQFNIKFQKLILNVWDFFKQVKNNPDLLDEIRTAQERAAAALHVSTSTISKISKNLKRTGKFKTQVERKRKRSKPIVDSVDALGEEVIRTIIQEMKSNKVTPNIRLVLEEARQKINFIGGSTSLRRILKRMGLQNLSHQSKPGTPGRPGPDGMQGKTEKIIIPIAHRTAETIQGQQIQMVNTNTMVTAQTMNGETIQINQAIDKAIASAVQASNQQPQTIHVVQPGNTVQPIQIVYDLRF